MVENLYFWSSVETFRQDSPTRQMACDIYDKFINPDGPFCINISHAHREIIEDAMTNIRRLEFDNIEVITVFDEAQTEIFELMKSNSLYRFLESRDQVTLQEVREDSVSVY